MSDDLSPFEKVRAGRDLVRVNNILGALEEELRHRDHTALVAESLAIHPHAADFILSVLTATREVLPPAVALLLGARMVRAAQDNERLAA